MPRSKPHFFLLHCKYNQHAIQNSSSIESQSISKNTFTSKKQKIQYSVYIGRQIMFEIGEEIKDCKSNYDILRMNKKKQNTLIYIIANLLKLT